MIARLSAGFVFSVLLHGVLLWAIEPRMQAGHDRPGMRSMRVQFMAQGRARKPHTSAARPAKEKGARIPSAPERVVAQAPSISASANPLPVFSGSVRSSPFAPGMQHQAQIGYQQMYAMQARLHMLEQVRLEAMGLQASIEQRVGQSGGHAQGRCAWRDSDMDGYQCESQALATLMQPDERKLGALRKALRVQGVILEGFTIDTGGTPKVAYQVHPAGYASTP